jgi:hypothetical protein
MSGTIHVIATTIDGTKAALKAAIPAATQRGARVVLLLPRAPAADIERPSVADRALMLRYEDMLKRLHHPVQVRVCLASNAMDVAVHLIPERAWVFVGGPVRVFWRSAEERLAARLRRSGREVVFIGCNDGEARMKTGVLSHA